LDLQLKKHGIHQLIVTGLIAHTCVEATVRYAGELGNQVTMVKDATADYSDVEMHAALDVNIPNYASAIVTTNEDSRKYASTGGWGFAQFNDGKPAGEAVHNTCFSCHEAVKARASLTGKCARRFDCRKLVRAQ
jgi:hypothetical protein